MLSSSLLDPLNSVAMRQFVQISLRKIVSCYRPSAWRHPISLELSGLVVAVQDRWWRRVCWQPIYKLPSWLYWWSEGHAEHIFVGVEDNYCCICQFLLIRSIHPKLGSLCQFWHLGHREWWAYNLGVAEITLSRSSKNFALTSSGWSSLSQMRCWLPDKGRFSVMRTSVPFGRPESLPTRPVLMANPTSASCISSLLRPLQKNV